MNHQQQSVHEQLANKVLSVQPATRCLVAVNGKDASGKTMFADALATYLQTQVNPSNHVLYVPVISYLQYPPKESI